ncbi:MAG: TonB-dependent siderophore receptor [Betaproteobacteria bacterium]|nr:MAG: TonB-dependent siderophore receptor [Betaproteobacteria bacterium]
MAHTETSLSIAVALATATLAVNAASQTTPTTERTEPITVSAKSAPVLDIDNAEVGGFGAPISKTPQSIAVVGSDLITATASQSLSQVLKLDASLTDSYNTTGFIESLSVRGFLLTNENNFRRNGLATSNYAPIALENIERIEVLKGVAGLQSGVSAPGGLVNYVTKTPLRDAFSTVMLGVDQRGGVKTHIDLNRTFNGLGVRVNAASEQMHSHADRADGRRTFVSAALAVALNERTSVSLNAEHHERRQPSVPGVGLLDSDGDGVGETLPGRINPSLNLNNQSWSLPFEAKTSTAQLTLNHRLNNDWSARISANTQRSKINDRIAFPDGCGNAATYVYPGLCANGDVDIYDYRSDDEQRALSSWDAQLNGRVTTGGIEHTLRLGASGRKITLDASPRQAYNYVGSSNIFLPTSLPSNGEALDLNTDNRERTTELYASVHSKINARWLSFAGIRTSKLSRGSERSDGSRATSIEQTVSTPWIGSSYAVSDDTTLYANWGQGVELDVVPNRSSRFVNFGEALPALKSKQVELGAKWQVNPRLLATAALFEINKPFADDLRQADGRSLRVAGAKTARHRGAEFTAAGRINDALSLQASLMALDATFTRAVDPTLVGTRVTNVPRLKASLFADYKVTALRGLSLNSLLTTERGKNVNADGSTRLPSAWQLDAGLSYQRTVWNKASTWRINVENLSNRIYWREAPTQSWGGVYLFPSTPRTVRASVLIDF